MNDRNQLFHVMYNARVLVTYLFVNECARIARTQVSGRHLDPGGRPGPGFLDTRRSRGAGTGPATRNTETETMSQNIYDDPEFFAGYSRLGRSVEGLNGAAEWPALRAMLPPIRGLRVCDLGCGFGWFCVWAREQGAASVLGLDVSENMLALARAGS